MKQGWELRRYPKMNGTTCSPGLSILWCDALMSTTSSNCCRLAIALPFVMSPTGTVVLRLAIALGIGLLIGAERERCKGTRSVALSRRHPHLRSDLPLRRRQPATGRRSFARGGYFGHRRTGCNCLCSHQRMRPRSDHRGGAPAHPAAERTDDGATSTGFGPRRHPRSPSRLASCSGVDCGPCRFCTPD